MTQPTPPADSARKDSGHKDQPSPAAKSPYLRRGLIWASGVASTMLFALGTELFASVWSGYRAVGWVLAIVIALGLTGWWYSTVAERNQRRRERQRNATRHGPPAPVEPNWSPDDVDVPNANAVVQRLRSTSSVDLEPVDRQDELERAVACRMLKPSDASPGQTAERAARFNLGNLDERGVATALFAAFGLGVPDSDESSLSLAADRLVESLQDPPTLVVLTNASNPDAHAWLKNALPDEGPPWLLVAGRHEVQESTTDDPADVEARALLRALATLPNCELGADAVAAVYAAVAPSESAKPLHELLTTACAKKWLECSPVTARYHVPANQRDHLRNLRPENDDRTGAALHVVLQHYARACRSWRTALRTADHAATAAHWFRAEEHVLRVLVDIDLEDEQVVDAAALIEPVITICDALDVWYARQHAPTQAKVISQALARNTGSDDNPYHALAQVRQQAAERRLSGDTSDLKEQDLRKHPLRSGVRARHHHEAGLREFAKARSAAPKRQAQHLNNAVDRFREAWLALPRTDVAGEIAVAVNLAVVHLHQGKLDQAQDRLELAEALARRHGDADSEAHVHEIQGIAAWLGGRRDRAVDLWWDAVCTYRAVEDQRGESRCLQHLGTALHSNPDLARHVPIEHDSTLDDMDEQVALRQAHDWLQRSLLLRPDQPRESLAEHYRAKVRSRLPRELEPSKPRRPPVPLAQLPERATGRKFKRFWRPPR